jgi:FkbM family methyltransferase
MSGNTEFVELSGYKVYIDRERYSETMINALKYGSYEIGERTFSSRVFQKGDRILEIGSSIGAVSMVLAGIVGQENYVGYEANPELLPDALKNFRANGMELYYHTAVLRNRVRGGAGAPVNFYINKDFWISALEPSGNTIRQISVPLLCLEDEIAKFHANCLMLDIEGAEAELLEYADLTGINKIFMELHYWPSREAANKMLRYLILEGFSIDLENSSGANIALHRGLTKA